MMISQRSTSLKKTSHYLYIIQKLILYMVASLVEINWHGFF